MSVVTTISVTLLASLAAAYPGRLDKRSGGDPPGGSIVCSGFPPCVTISDHLAAPGGTCVINQQTTGGVAHEWRLAIPGDTLSNYGTPGGSDTLGGGLLDNLRGQCGTITDWTATSDNSSNLVCQFSTLIECGSDDVNNAIWLANGMHYEGNCEYNSGSSDGGIAEGVFGALEGLFDFLAELHP